PYNRSVAIYHCPADKSNVETPDGVQLSIRRSRSYNMSQSINGLPIDPELYILPPSFQKESDISTPSPSQLFVFIDVHAGRILYSLLGVPPLGWNVVDTDGIPAATTWWDLPANRHSQGCNFSFADGHVEYWKWIAPKIFEKIGQTVANEADLKDFRRVQADV